ncbi:MAG: DNA polymerase III subunit beta [Minisyncoccia bacterium]
MKIECIKEKLGIVVGKAEKVSGKNLTLPVLSCLLFETKKNLLYIKATNLDLGVEISIPVKIEESGSVAIPAQVLNNFLTNTDEDKNIIIETTENDNIKIYTPSNKAIIKTHAKEDFPTIPLVDADKTFKINSKDLIKGLRSVSFSSSVSTIKPEFSSVYMYCNEESVIFVATDSFRLAEKKIKTKRALDFSPILIPFKNTLEIMRIFDDIDDDIEVGITKNQISFIYNNIYIVSRVVDGTFPDYKQIIAKDFKTQATVLKQDLINTLKVSNIFSDNFNQINVKISPKTKTFTFKTKNSNVGENVNTIDSVLEGEDVEINFNYKYILDCLSFIDTDSITLFFNGLTKPMVICGTGDKSYTYLVMPMNR